MNRLTKAIAGLAGLATVVVAAPALAEWPERPITWIVPWGAGGAADQISRVVTPLIEQELGVPINVVLQPGGSGAVGHTALATAEPDGYTWGLGTVEISMMHWTGLADITAADFTVAAVLNIDTGGLIVAADSPYQSAEDLIDAIKAQPAGTFTASGTGQGGIWHLGLVGWMLAEGLPADQVIWVPNQGAGPSMQDLVAGGVNFVTASLPEGRALIDAGEARPLANIGPKRLSLYPDVPTLSEAVGTDWSILTWRGVFGPAGIPLEIRDKFIAALENAFNSDEFNELMASRGFGIAWIPGDEGTEFILEADAEFGRIMEAAGLAR